MRITDTPNVSWSQNKGKDKISSYLSVLPGWNNRYLLYLTGWKKQAFNNNPKQLTPTQDIRKYSITEFDYELLHFKL